MTAGQLATLRRAEVFIRRMNRMMEGDLTLEDGVPASVVADELFAISEQLVQDAAIARVRGLVAATPHWHHSDATANVVDLQTWSRKA